MEFKFQIEIKEDGRVVKNIGLFDWQKDATEAAKKEIAANYKGNSDKISRSVVVESTMEKIGGQWVLADDNWRMEYAMRDWCRMVGMKV